MNKSLFKKINIYPLRAAWEFLHLPQYPIINWEKDYDTLLKIHSEYDWDIDIELLKNSLRTKHTLVVTDPDQKIGYVSSAFTHMTGYYPEEAIGRKPNFLQGPETCKETTAKVRDAIKQQKIMKTTVINYRKNGSIYHCDIEIIPINNHSGELTNFMAIEKVG